MRIGILPDHPLETLVLGTGMVPTPLVASFWGMGLARCLIVAVRLELFEAVAAAPRSAEVLARDLGFDPGGLAVMLHALNGFGYLRVRGGVYHNASVTRRWLLRGSRWSMAEAIDFFGDLWDQLEGLEATVRSGHPPRLHEVEHPPAFWRRYLRGLASFARLAGGLVTRALPLESPPRRMLDVGGGHGMYAAAFCRRYPGLLAEVLDLPEAVAVGQEVVAEAGLAGRIHFRAQDMRGGDWGEGYDLVLLFNVLHNATPEEARALVATAYRTLRPGGTLAVADSEHRPHRGNVSTVAGFNELFFYLLSGARAYPEATMREWLAAAGFTGLRTTHVQVAPLVLLSARRPLT